MLFSTKEAESEELVCAQAVKVKNTEQALL